jgi:hypothetical protein
MGNSLIQWTVFCIEKVTLYPDVKIYLEFVDLKPSIQNIRDYVVNC